MAQQSDWTVRATEQSDRALRYHHFWRPSVGKQTVRACLDVFRELHIISKEINGAKRNEHAYERAELLKMMTNTRKLVDQYTVNIFKWGKVKA